MANPNNLIRPPVLGNQGEPNRHANNEVDIASLVSRITLDVIRNQVPALIQEALNPNAILPNVDQIIDQQYRNNLTELDKIPDVVKGLRDFSGNPAEFNSWKKSVDRILKIYEDKKGTPKYYGILSVVRNKIVGNADTALESYNTPLDWSAIAKCLTLHYADKRDISTLEYQLTSMIQGKLPVEEFYQAVYTHLSLILNKLGGLEISNESLGLLTQTYRDKALDTFVRGLNGDLPRLLGIKEPADLPQALHLCLKLQNQNFRSDYARNNNYTGRRPQFQYEARPPLPPKPNKPSFQTTHFYPQLAHLPQTSNNFSKKNPNWQHYPTNSHQNVYHEQPQRYYHPALQFNGFPNQQQPPPRPQGQKPQPKPEPMEVDGSLQTRRINYMNRPQGGQFMRKRHPPPPSGNIQQKIQRTFHIDNNEREYYEQEVNAVENEYDQTWEEYLPQDVLEQDHQQDEAIELSDINFLG